MMPNPADTPDADDLRAARLLQQALARPGEILEIEPSSPPQPARPFVRQGTGRLSPAMKTVLQALSGHAAPPRLALTTAAEVDPAVWQTPTGTPAMLLIEVPALRDGRSAERARDDEDPDLTPCLCIDGTRHLSVAGIARHFWRRRPEADPADPGVDLVLCSDRRLVAIGRQSRVWLCS